MQLNYQATKGGKKTDDPLKKSRDMQSIPQLIQRKMPQA